MGTVKAGEPSRFLKRENEGNLPDTHLPDIVCKVQSLEEF